MAALAGEQNLKTDGLSPMHRTVSPLSGKLLLSGLLLVAVPLLCLLLWSNAQKGVWNDELWSKWMTSRELALGDAARERWFQDAHPPLFYLINWTLNAVIGPDVVQHRWLNVGWLAALGGVGAYLARFRPGIRPALVVGALLLLSNRDIALFGEYRSYAMITCATAALMLLMGEMIARERDLALPQDRTLAIMLGIVIALALNLHYISTLICGIAIGVFSLDRARLGYWRWAATMLGVAMVAMLPVVGSLWAQQPFLAAAVPDFWVKTSAFAGVRMAGSKVVLATGFNLVVIACVVLELRRGVAAGTPRHFAVLAIASAAAACLLLIAINLFKPIIVPRYLVALSPIIIIALAAIVGPRIASRRWLFLAFLGNAGVVALLSIWPIASTPAWDEGARRVAAVVRDCPSTKVYTMFRMNGRPVSRFSALPNEVPFVRWAMADLGRSYGVTPVFVDPTSPPAPLPLAAGGCPTLLWIEHAAKLDGPLTAAAAGLVGGALETVHTRTGTIIMQSAR